MSDVGLCNRHGPAGKSSSSDRSVAASTPSSHILASKHHSPRRGARTLRGQADPGLGQGTQGAWNTHPGLDTGERNANCFSGKDFSQHILDVRFLKQEHSPNSSHTSF